MEYGLYGFPQTTIDESEGQHALQTVSDEPVG